MRICPEVDAQATAARFTVSTTHPGGNLIMTQTCLECKDPWTSPYPALYRASPKFHPRSPGYFCHDGCALAWHTRKVYGGRVPHPKGGDPCPIG